jgi:hypothetical protein
MKLTEILSETGGITAGSIITIMQPDPTSDRTVPTEVNIKKIGKGLTGKIEITFATKNQPNKTLDMQTFNKRLRQYLSQK